MNAISRRRLLGATALGLGTAGFGGGTACMPSPSDESSGNGDDANEEMINFTFASFGLADAISEDVISQQMRTFAEQHDITVDGLPIGYPEYLPQLTLRLRGQEVSGAAQMDISWLSAVAATGTLRDVSDVVADQGYLEPALTSGQVDGVQYGVPWTIGAIGMIANADLLGQVGADDVPSDIDEFEALLIELKALGVTPYAASTKVAQLKDILIWMQTFGSPVVDGDTVTIGDDASVDAVTWYKRLYDQGLIAADVERNDARTLMAQEGAAIYDDAVIGPDYVISESAVSDLETKLFPAARPVVNKGDDPRALQWGHCIVITEGETAHAASEYARWVSTDRDTVIKQFEMLGLPPATEELQADPAVQDDDFVSSFAERITATATPSPFTRFPQYAEMEAEVAEQVQAVLIGQATPAEAMEAAGEAVQDLIE